MLAAGLELIPEVAYVAAKMHLAAVMAEAGRLRFREVLEIVAGG